MTRRSKTPPPPIGHEERPDRDIVVDPSDIPVPTPTRRGNHRVRVRRLETLDVRYSVTIEPRDEAPVIDPAALREQIAREVAAESAIADAALAAEPAALVPLPPHELAPVVPAALAPVPQPGALAPVPPIGELALATAHDRAMIEQLSQGAVEPLDPRVRDRSTLPKEAPPPGRERRTQAFAQDVVLWIAVLAGPFAWFLDHVVAWVITPPANVYGKQLVLRAIHVVALVVPCIAAALAVHEMRWLRGTDSADVAVQRARFMALLALFVSGISFLLILGNLIPALILVPGEEP